MNWLVNLIKNMAINTLGNSKYIFKEWISSFKELIFFKAKNVFLIHPYINWEYWNKFKLNFKCVQVYWSKLNLLDYLSQTNLQKKSTANME